jgi:hypothetical protein
MRDGPHRRGELKGPPGAVRVQGRVVGLPRRFLETLKRSYHSRGIPNQPVGVIEKALRLVMYPVSE